MGRMGFLHARKLRKAREDRELAALKGPSQERQETEEEVHARVRLEEPIMASWEQGPSVEKLADSLEQAASDLESIGRAREDAYLFDLRCLDDEAGFVAQLANLPSKWRARP